MTFSTGMLGRRLHLHHGPIDLIIEGWGEDKEVQLAYRQAEVAFASVLQSLVDELPELRQPAGDSTLSGPVAKRMVEAVSRHDVFVTPMAAVAGSVADHVLAAMCADRMLVKACVNNGGDISFLLQDGESLTVGVGDMNEQGVTLAPVKICANDGVGGVATSGWRGRSHSLGIADFVTVFAKDSASADVAATLIANAVDVPSPRSISRLPAQELSPDSDLGDRLVTVKVGPLSPEEVSIALSRGIMRAEAMVRDGLIVAACLGLQGQRRLVGSEALLESNPEIEARGLEGIPMMGESA